jgi:hypothetical protein
MYCSRDGLTTCKLGCMWVLWFMITTLYALYIKEGVKSVSNIKMSIVTWGKYFVVVYQILENSKFVVGGCWLLVECYLTYANHLLLWEACNMWWKSSKLIKW